MMNMSFAFQLRILVTFALQIASTHAETEHDGLCPLRGEYRSELFPVTAEFWRPGVQHSKEMLDEILEKITMFEKTKFLTNVLIDEANKMMREQLTQDGLEVTDGDEQSIRIAINTGNMCTHFTDIPSATVLREINFSCAEEEQLYGIATQRLYEPGYCRDEALVKKLRVAWDVCLAHHYPWINPASTRICVVKTNYGSFVACYCNKQGEVFTRGFCISKLECFKSKSGVDAIEGPISLSAECEEQLSYLLDGGNKDRRWFVDAQRADKLRPRGAYGKYSHCYGHNFTGLFDIGQLLLEDLESELEILTPDTLPPQQLDNTEQQRIQEQLKNSSSDEGGGGRKEGAGQIRIEGQEEVLYSVNKIMQPEEEYIVSSKDGSGQSIYCRLPSHIHLIPVESGATSSADLLELKAKIIVWAVISTLHGLPQLYKRLLTESSSWPLHIINKLTGASLVAVKMCELSLQSYNLYWQQQQQADHDVTSSTANQSTLIFNLIVWYIISWAYANTDVVSYCWKLAAFTLAVDVVLVQFLGVSPELYHWVLVAELLFSVFKIIHMTASVNMEENGESVMSAATEATNVAVNVVGGCGGAIVNSRPNVLRTRRRGKRLQQNCQNKNAPLPLSPPLPRPVAANSDGSTPVSPPLASRSGPREKETNKNHRTIVEVNCLAHVMGASTAASHVSITCTAKCVLLYHQSCWKALLDSSNRKSDREILGESCFTPNCWGFIRELSWFDMFGCFTNKKLTYKDPKPKPIICKENSVVKNKTPKKKELRQKIVNNVAPLQTAQSTSNSTTSNSSVSSPTTEQSNISSYKNSESGYYTDQSYRPPPVIYREDPKAITYNIPAEGVFGERRSPNDKLSLPVGMVTSKKKKKQQKLNICLPALVEPKREASRYQQPSHAFDFVPFNDFEDPFDREIAYYEGNNLDPIGTPAKRHSNDMPSIGRDRHSTNSSSSAESPGLPMSQAPTLDYRPYQKPEGSLEAAASPARLSVSPGVDEADETVCYNIANYPWISPLAAILCHDMPWYPPNKLDQHLNRVCQTQDTKKFTLEQFRSVLAKEIEKEAFIQFEDEFSEEIFESDDETDFLLEEGEICPICHETLIESVMRIVPCGHDFHSKCINGWCGKDRSCPTCRAPVTLLEPSLPAVMEDL